MPYLIPGGSAQFTEDTKKYIGVGRLKIGVSGKNLIPIIDAIALYESTLKQMDLEKRQGALCSVISKCQKWLRAKQGKIAAAREAQATVLLRQGRINALMLEAWNVLQATDGGEMSQAFQAYSTRKASGRVGAASGLSEGYAPERNAYVQSGKTKSLSGSLIDDLLGTGKTRNVNLPPGGNNNPVRQAAISANRQRKAQIQAAVGHREFSSLTVKDWEKIEQIAASIGVGPGAMETRYMKRPSRLRCMLDSNGANGLHYSVGSRSAETPAGTQRPYAMDEWGNLYTADDLSQATRRGYAMFNHSSFTAGDDVVCAGMMEIWDDGKLRFIDTNSGHYKPTADQLRAALIILRDDYHVDFSRAEISVAAPVRVVWGPGQLRYFLAGAPPVPPKPALPPRRR